MLRHSSFIPRLHRSTSGTVAITFLLSLPILLFIISILSQYALEINARLVLNHALSAAARSAVTALPTDPSVDTVGDPNFGNALPLDGTAFVNKAARMQLETISPNAPIAPTSEATDVADALKSVGIQVQSTYAGCYTFASNATTLSWERVDDNGNAIGGTWDPINFAQARGQRIKLSLTYNFFLSVPGARLLIGHPDNIAGINGRFVTMTSSCFVQLTHGRETRSNSDGSPQ